MSLLGTKSSGTTSAGASQAANQQQQAATTPGAMYGVPGYTNPVEQLDTTQGLVTAGSGSQQNTINGITPLAQTDVVLGWDLFITYSFSAAPTAGSGQTLSVSPYAPYNLLGPCTLALQNQYKPIDVLSGRDLGIFQSYRPKYQRSDRRNANLASPVLGAAYSSGVWTEAQLLEGADVWSTTYTTTGKTFVVHFPASIEFDLYYPLDIAGNLVGTPGRAIVSPQYMGGPLALDTEIRTSQGWKKLSALVLGDEVYGSDGLPTPIIGFSQVFNRACYAVHFADDVIVTDFSHGWTVVDAFGMRRDVTTREMFDDGGTFCVPVAASDDIKKIDRIEPVSSVPTQCITIGNKDHLFQAGRSGTLTHNTTRIVTPKLTLAQGLGTVDTSPFATTDLTAGGDTASTWTTGFSTSLDIRRYAIYSSNNPNALPPVQPWQYALHSWEYGAGAQTKITIPLPNDVGQILSLWALLLDPAAASGAGAPLAMSSVTYCQLKYGSGLYRFDDTPTSMQARWIQQHDTLPAAGFIGWDCAYQPDGRITNQGGILNTLTTNAIQIVLTLGTPMSSSGYVVVGTESLQYVVPQ